MWVAYNIISDERWHPPLFGVDILLPIYSSKTMIYFPLDIIPPLF